jgi:hypothetical protein
MQEDESYLNKRGLTHFWENIDALKQDKLTAGANITIASDNTISASQPTVNNATLTIQKEGASVGTFTANASTNSTVNIIETDPTVPAWAKASSKPTYTWTEITNRPTNVSAFTNDAGYLTNTNYASASTGGVIKVGGGLEITNGVLSATGGGTADAVEWLNVLNRPSDVSYWTNDAGYITSADLPTVGNATLTIQRNGASAGTFTANATSNKTINITVPTTAADVSALPASTKYGASIAVSVNTTDYKVTTTLKDQDGNTLGTAQVIDLPLESVVVNGSYDSTNKKIVLTLQSGSTIDIPVADLVAGLQSEITSTNKLASDLVDDTNQTHKFMTSAEKTKLSGIAAGAEVNVQSDWNQTTTTADDYIKNKPTLATVATSGSYNDLSNKPTIPTVNNATLTIQKNGTNVQTFTANQGTNATANIVVPTKTSDLTNDSGFLDSVAWGDVTGKPTFATVATSGSYNDLSNKPTIPTVNNATLTIQKNGTNVQTFTANQSTNATANITVPTKTSEITNDSGFVTSSGTVSKANQLTTARTIAISGGATGTATSFNGTSNISIPITGMYETYLNWGNQNLSGRVSCVDAALSEEFSANRLAYMDASKITVEYSRDGGSTWTDYGLTNAQKVGLVTTSQAIYTGGTNSNAASNYQVRVDLHPTNPYMSTRKLFIYISTGGVSNAQVLVERKGMNDTAYTTVTAATISGWSGWNSIPLAITFGGTSSWSNSNLRLTFSYNGKSTDYPNAQLTISKIRLYGETAWSAPSNLATNGHLYTYDTSQNATFPADVSVTGSLKHGSYTYTLPNKNGTVAMTSDIPSVPTVNNGQLTIQKNGSNVATFTANQSGDSTANISVPTKTSDITNDSNFTTTTTAQEFAIGQGSTNPVFDDMTPVRTIEWDVSDTTYRPIYQMANTGWTYINMDITVAYRITVTGTNINSVTDVVDRWINPISYPLTSMVCKTLSISAATTGLKYLRAVYPTSSYLNNASYPLGVEVEMHNTTARHIKVEVFKDNSQVTWNTTKPSGSIYVSSTYNGNRTLEVYATRGWRFHQPSQMYANSAGQASYIADFEATNIAAGDLKTGATALVAGHYAFLADDGLVYDISNTAKNIAMGESKVGFMNSAVAANTAISWTYWRAISRPSATQVNYIPHDTLALGNRVFLRCTIDSGGNIHSDNYLSTTMSPNYTWMPFGWARSTSQVYVDTRHPMFYTLDANGKMTHINGKELAGSGAGAYSAGDHIDITNGVISAEGYVHSESPVSTSSVTPIVTGSMITNGTITADKLAAGATVQLTLSTSDIGEGAALAANTLYGVYL